MTTKPMEGLAEWLRGQALFAKCGTEQLKRWASEVEAARLAALEEAAAVAERAFGGNRAHTYASENADRYRAQDEARRLIAAAIRSLKEKP